MYVSKSKIKCGKLKQTYVEQGKNKYKKVLRITKMVNIITL